MSGMEKAAASAPRLSGETVMDRKVAVLLLSTIGNNCAKLNDCVERVGSLGTEWVITAFATYERQQHCGLDLFTVYCGSRRLIANCVLVRLHSPGIIAPSPRTMEPAPFWRNFWYAAGQVEKD